MNHYDVNRRNPDNLSSNSTVNAETSSFISEIVPTESCLDTSANVNEFDETEKVNCETENQIVKEVLFKESYVINYCLMSNTIYTWIL